MKRIAKVVIALVVGTIALALIAPVAVLLIIDPNAYRPLLQRQASNVLGRDISIDRLTVAKSIYPTIEVTGLRISNPTWASRPHFVSVRSAAVRLDLVALIRGGFEIGSVEVNGVDLLLERDRNGVGNWEFTSAQPNSTAIEELHVLGFQKVSIRDAKIGWRGAANSTTSVRIETADAVFAVEEPLQIDTVVVYEQVPIIAKLVTSNSLANALSGRPLLATVSLRALDARATLEIALPKLLDFTELSVNFAANGQQLDELSVLFDQTLPAWGPYRVSGRASFAPGLVRLDNLSMLLEGLLDKTPFMLSRLEIESGVVSGGRDVPTSLQLTGKLDDTSFGVEATTTSLAHLVARENQIAVQARVKLDEFETSVEGGILLSAESLPFDVATHVRGDVRVPARLFQVPQLRQALQVDMAGRIKGDTTRLTATELNGTVAQCVVAGHLSLQRDFPSRFNGELELGRLDIAAFETAGDKAPPPEKQQALLNSPRWLDTIDVDLRLRVADVIGLPVTVSKLSAHGILEGGRLEVRNFRGSVAGTQLHADAGLEWKHDRAQVELQASMPVLDIAGLRGENGRDQDPDEDNFLDTLLPLAPLRLVDTDVTVNIGRIQGAPVTIDNLRGSGHLKRGRLRIPSLRATLATIPVTGTMVLDAKGNEARLSASMSTGQVDVAGLLAKLGSEAPVSGKINRAEATVETEGASVRDLIRKAKAAARVGTSTFEHRDGKRQFIVQRASAIAGPNLNSRAEIHGEFGEFPIELLMVGGRLSELFEARAPWPKVRAELHTIVEKQPVHVTAMSSLDPIVRGRDVPIHVSAHMEGARVVVAGTIADMEYPERAPLEASIKINSLSRLPFMLEGPALPDIPISAKARVVVDEDAISVGGLVLSSGQSNLAGEMRLVYESRPKLTANLDSKLLDLRPYIPRDAGRDTGTATARFDEPLDLKIFQGIDFDIDVRVQRFITHLLDLNQFYLKANLHDRLLRMSLSMAEGNSLVELGFNARTKRPIMAARLKTTDLDLESLKPQHVALMGTEIPLVTVNAQFSGTGMTLREVYQSAKGKLVFSSGPGKLVPSSKPFIAQAVSSDLLETLVPGRRPDDYNQLECAAAHFNVADGIAASPDGIALRFKRMDILGSGAVNLTTREIMFGFKAVRRRFFSFSILSLTSDFARISGTIDKPRVGLDTSGVFVTGGAAWATAGLSLLATNFLRTLASSENPCSAIIEKGRTAEDPVKSLMKGLHVPGVR